MSFEEFLQAHPELKELSLSEQKAKYEEYLDYLAEISGDFITG